MNTLKFKTNIKCSGCIAQTTPYLNEAAGEKQWEVDINNPDKILTVSTEGATDSNKIIQAVQKAGYKAEQVQEPRRASSFFEPGVDGDQAN